VGSKVKFEDEDGDDIKGVITELDGEDVTVEDSGGDEWGVLLSELNAA
jgi:hypothetical protein